MVKTMNSSEHIQTTFPKELLEQSIDNRLAYFRDTFFWHPNVYQAIENLKRITTHPVGKRSVNLYGPTGTGKTTTLTVVRKHFTEQAGPVNQSGQERGPIVSVSAFSDEPHRFSWKDFYRKILNEIAIQYAPAQIAIDVQGIRYEADGQLYIHDRVTVSQLRETVIQALLQMRPLALFIDEAHHVNKLGKGLRSADQMDIIKSLTDMSETLFVLVGTYELMAMINLNGQQGRRSYDLPLMRYRWNNKEERAQYKEVVRRLQCNLPLHQPPDLVTNKMHKYLYEHSLGCVGLLKPWLDRALSKALNDTRYEQPVLLKEHLDATKDESGTLLRIMGEIRQGETAMQKTEQDYTQEIKKFMAGKSSIFGT